MSRSFPSKTLRHSKLEPDLPTHVRSSQICSTSHSLCRAQRVVVIVACVGIALLLGGLSRGRSAFHSQDVARNPAYLIKAKSGAVASENIVCSDLGVDVMKDGGNAVDAAVAATFCIGVVNMFSWVFYSFSVDGSYLRAGKSSGIGGGGFMTVRVPTSKDKGSSEIWTIDFRETAPALANKTMYNNDPTKARFGGLSVGIPGEVRGLEVVHKRWGSLPWERLVQPSVELAAGWKVGRELSKRINVRSFIRCFVVRRHKPLPVGSPCQSFDDKQPRLE